MIVKGKQAREQLIDWVQNYDVDIQVIVKTPLSNMYSIFFEPNVTVQENILMIMEDYNNFEFDLGKIMHDETDVEISEGNDVEYDEIVFDVSIYRFIIGKRFADDILTIDEFKQKVGD